jgi:hypothetical protein
MGRKIGENRTRPDHQPPQSLPRMMSFVPSPLTSSVDSCEQPFRPYYPWRALRRLCSSKAPCKCVTCLCTGDLPIVQGFVIVDTLEIEYFHWSELIVVILIAASSCHNSLSRVVRVPLVRSAGRYQMNWTLFIRHRVYVVMCGYGDVAPVRKLVTLTTPTRLLLLN